ncbi:hypothetical protein B0J11DRAFT_93429 [Dendryphion nanum]|uniref:Uncharacterized protein n=1 Tax=Dendryphion nanum TaxID=256645 RepID=A0A9P9IEI9_9PLEO|nr:hypothetical protein B0J11DRAFT_93429 [Dendryphion nanum]
MHGLGRENYHFVSVILLGVKGCMALVDSIFANHHNGICDQQVLFYATIVDLSIVGNYQQYSEKYRELQHSFDAIQASKHDPTFVSLIRISLPGFMVSSSAE